MEVIKQLLLEKTIRCCNINKGRVWRSNEGLWGCREVGQGISEESYGRVWLLTDWMDKKGNEGIF